MARSPVHAQARELRAVQAVSAPLLRCRLHQSLQRLATRPGAQQPVSAATRGAHAATRAPATATAAPAAGAADGSGCAAAAGCRRRRRGNGRWGCRNGSRSHRSRRQRFQRQIASCSPYQQKYRSVLHMMMLLMMH